MKKLIALALALVMVLGLSVSAFAAVKLVKVEDEETDPTEIKSIGLIAKDENNTKETFVAPKAGTYYVEVEGAKDAKNLAVSATGNVAAKLTEVDPTDDSVVYVESAEGANDALNLENYYVKALDNFTWIISYKKATNAQIKEETVNHTKTFTAKVDLYKEVKGEYELAYAKDDVIPAEKINGTFYMVDRTGTITKGDKLVWDNENTSVTGRGKGKVDHSEIVDLMYEADELIETGRWANYNTYEDATALKKALNEKFNTTKFQVFDNGDLPTVIEVTVGENYSAAYKTGTVTLTGKIKDATTGKYVDAKYEFDVISDVVIFGRQDVLDFAGNTALDSSMKGYSDFYSAKRGYNDPDEQLYWDGPVVVPTTSFTAVVGEDVSYTADSTIKTEMYIGGSKTNATFTLTATIKDVVAAQKGVNFTTAAKAVIKNDANKNTKLDDTEALKAIELGFKGDQVIASDYEIEVESKLTWFELRELFQEKLEENDVLKFYLLKDGKAYNEIVVDYGKQTITVDGETDPIDVTADTIDFTILGKAGNTLGWYTLTLEAPVAPEEGEENPNTGAESMVGAVIALAVVSMASAAAVSLKK